MLSSVQQRVTLAGRIIGSPISITISTMRRLRATVSQSIHMSVSPTLDRTLTTDLRCMQVCAYNTGALALTTAARYLLFPLCGWPGLNHRWRRWYTRGRFLRHPPRHSLGQGQALRGRCVRRRSGHATRGGWADRDGFLNCVHICPCAKQQAREPQPEP